MTSVESKPGQRLVGRTEPSKQGDYRVGFALVIGFVLIQLAANLSDLKTTDILGGQPIPSGSLLYALSFTWIDRVNEHFGRRRARWLVAISALGNTCVVLWLQLYIALPSGTGTPPGGQEALEAVYGAVPRVFAASILTALIVENVDITIYSYLKRTRPRLPAALRSAGSNTISAPLDGVIFVPLAFAGSLPWDTIGQIILVSAAYKLLVAYGSVPLLFSLRRRRTA